MSVTAVVCAAFDEAAEARILRLRAIARAAGARLPDVPRHRPHITLGAARVDDITAITDLAGTIAQVQAAFTVRLDRTGTFPRAGVLWLGTSSSNDLAAVQQAVDEALTMARHGRAFGERSAPGRWTAHCTLATRLPPDVLRRAAAAVGDNFVPFGARVTSLVTIVVGGHGDAGLAPLAG